MPTPDQQEFCTNPHQGPVRSRQQTSRRNSLLPPDFKQDPLDATQTNAKRGGAKLPLDQFIATAQDWKNPKLLTNSRALDFPLIADHRPLTTGH